MIEIYTDGGCHGNPGPGAWAFVVVQNPLVQMSGREKETTNNRMELLAVISSLRYCKSHYAGQEVLIHTDSQYVQKGLTEWIKNWQKNGWKTADKKPVKNKDLWIELLEASQGIALKWQWVKGHAGNTYNELCDELVQIAIKNS